MNKDSNNKIILSIIFVFIVSFASFFIFYNMFPDHRVDTNHPFYSQEFDTNTKKIFLVGSSTVGQLNSTLIKEEISNQYEDYLVYNVAYGSDRPKIRDVTIQQIINLNPEIVVYGISYRDFSNKINQKTNLFPDPNQVFHELTSSVKINEQPINPKFRTLETIRDSFRETGLFPKKEGINIPNTPFYTYLLDAHINILNEKMIENNQKHSDAHDIHIKPLSSNEQIIYFKKILDELSKNNIKIIIFTTPLHRTYLDIIPIQEQKVFDDILEHIIDEYDVKFYDFTEKYVGFDVWASDDHVAYNKNSMIYSEDIAKIILKEIEE